ncbi:uncharacterized protein LOC103720010 [Phoenix dactylifera]|uniref:Uncharacterized protein LOC103720010 n=1 Tax=Phoenix dactylifera TaxID=42345 RepID=A0A8B7CW91_PHODC|nr:uncharacterized protein LOC103720010 [Phoenix dactylifera]XP_008807745.2 uncharacterized protein LOC103720010 [Phoenix dactylifera]
MDGSTPHASMVSEGIGCETSVYSLSCEKSHREHKEGTCCNMKGTAKITPERALDVSFVSEEDNFIVREAGTVPGAFLHASNLGGRLSDPNAISDQEETRDSKEIETCQESCGSVSLDANKLKSLNKCATFPCSSEAQLDTLPIKGSNEESSTEVQGQPSSTFKSPAYSRSMSLPTSLKLVSAMKGGRAQNGVSPTVKLQVKWAPEVYDPPATSLSHTVKKSHHQRPKAKKKDNHKNKHNKGRSSRGSGLERKRANQSSIGTVSNPLDMRFPVAGDRLLLDRFGKSNAEALEYAVSTRESKCGGGFLREALAKVNLSTAEAS